MDYFNVFIQYNIKKDMSKLLWEEKWEIILSCILKEGILKEMAFIVNAENM
jgi:hypothetical protein